MRTFIASSSIVPSLVWAFIAITLASGCSHMITVESSPPGALVLVEDKPIGRTPVTFEETTSRADVVTVEVQQGQRSARFAYQKTAVSMDAVAGSVAGSCGMCALGGGSLAAMFVVVPAFALANPAAGIAILVGAYVGYVGATMLVSYAPYVMVLGVGEGGRKGPERIHVDFTRSPGPLVTTTPDGMAVPLVGRTAKKTAPAQRF